tara:strand:- start:216 stop:461 length:246 start_codon:yes stop_codon:yes gene_type:complete
MRINGIFASATNDFVAKVVTQASNCKVLWEFNGYDTDFAQSSQSSALIAAKLVYESYCFKCLFCHVHKLENADGFDLVKRF